MPREFSRGNRVADLIQKELAILIQRELKDPRIGMVTVNEVTVSRDLAYGEVYVTVLPEDRYEEAIDVLQQAAGFLRSQLAKTLTTRTTPKLRFHYDKTMVEGARISKVINDAVKYDEAHHVEDSSQQAEDSSKDDSK